MRQAEWCLQTMRRGMNGFLMRVAWLSLSFGGDLVMPKKAACISSSAYAGCWLLLEGKGRGLRWRAAIPQLLAAAQHMTAQVHQHTQLCE